MLFTSQLDDEVCTEPDENVVSEEPWEEESSEIEESHGVGYIATAGRSLFPGLGLLMANKQVHNEASSVLYAKNTFRFNSHQMSKVLGNPNVFDNNCHIELENVQSAEWLNLRALIKKLSNGKSMQSITIGINAGGRFLWRAAQAISLTDEEAGDKGFKDFSLLLAPRHDVRRINCHDQPRVSFFNFIKEAKWRDILASLVPLPHETISSSEIKLTKKYEGWCNKPVVEIPWSLDIV